MSLFIISEYGELKGNIEELLNYNSTVLEIPAEINGIKVVKIADDAFMIDEEDYYDDEEGCGGNALEKIVEIKIANGIEEIGENAFRSCFNLKKVVLPESLKILGESVFQNCYVLENCVLPATLKIISAFAFSNCFEFENVVGGENVEEIGDEAFAGTKITEITLPKSLKYIDETAFFDLVDVVVIRKYRETELPDFVECEVEIIEID